MKKLEQVCIITGAWDKQFRDASLLGAKDLRIICPFIKLKALERILYGSNYTRIKLITRFALTDIAAGVSDLSALRLLLKYGAQIRGIKNLHSKLYMFGTKRVIVTSANLTSAALSRNHEFGFVSEDSGAIKKCRDYFESLWCQAGDDLTETQLDQWEKQVDAARTQQKKTPGQTDLPDHGVHAGFATQEEERIEPFADSAQTFVKFFGKGDNRLPLDFSIWKEIEGSESHIALRYPTEKRPRIVKNGDIMFISRLTNKPNDIRIYGRATAIAYRQGIDDFSTNNLKHDKWKQEYSHLIRIHDAVFIDGPMSNGISLEEMMAELGSSCFETIKNIPGKNPRLSIRRQPAVRLSAKGRSWMEKKFQEAITNHGRISDSEMAKLHWV
jgi:HKD family nuclease